ncbi:MAG: hypothetical protein JRF15_16400 [Deltaproteobacteria bacterium]|nr:hypothetical protein [Deltaproteobacteria bacterium]
MLALGYVITRVAIGYPDPRRHYRRLGRGEVALISSAAEAMYPAGGPIPASGLDADLPDYIERLMTASGLQTRMLLHLLFFLVEHGTLVFPTSGRGGMRRFSAQDIEHRVAALDGWAESTLFTRRLVFTSLRAVLTMGYFAHPPVVRRLGLAPLAIEAPICEADLLYPRIGEKPESIRWTAEDLTPPSAGIPLPQDGTLHPGFAEAES